MMVRGWPFTFSAFVTSEKDINGVFFSRIKDPGRRTVPATATTSIRPTLADADSPSKHIAAASNAIEGTSTKISVCFYDCLRYG